MLRGTALMTHKLASTTGSRQGMRLSPLLFGLILTAVFSNSSIYMVSQTAISAGGRSDNVLYAELTKAPAKAIARPNPLENDRDAVMAGAKLYGQHCAECHGQTGEGGHGSKKGPTLRAVEVQQAAPGTLFWVLTNGVVRRGMPVWSKLPEPQRWQLVSFIKSLGAPAKGPTTGGTP